MKTKQGISNYHPMHASFSFHQSILQLAYTTQARIFNLKLVLCKQTYVIDIQMQHSSLWACSPYLCASNFNLIPFLCHFSISPPTFVNYFSPFVINDHKRWAPILDRLGCMWGPFSKIWFNLDHLPKKFNSAWSNDKLIHTS